MWLKLTFDQLNSGDSQEPIVECPKGQIRGKVDSPCFGQFAYCTTPELCKDAVEQAKRQQKCLDEGKTKIICCPKPVPYGKIEQIEDKWDKE